MVDWAFSVLTPSLTHSINLSMAINFLMDPRAINTLSIVRWDPAVILPRSPCQHWNKLAYILFDLVLTDTNQLFPEMSFLLEVLSLWVFIFLPFIRGHTDTSFTRGYTMLSSIVLYSTQPAILLSYGIFLQKRMIGCENNTPCYVCSLILWRCGLVVDT